MISNNVLQYDEKWFVIKVTSIKFVIRLIFLTKLLCMCLWFYVSVKGFIQVKFGTI